MRVKSAALLIAKATRRLFGAATSRMSPPSATLIGPIANVLRSRPPLTGPIRNGSAKPGTFTIPPLLERAADSSVSGHPRHIIPPVKYSSAVTPSSTPGWNARYHASKSEACIPSESKRSCIDGALPPARRNIPPNPIDESARHVLAPKISSLLDHLPCQYRFSLCHQAQTLRAIRNPVRVGAGRRPPATPRSSAE